MPPAIETPKEARTERDLLWLFDLALILKAFDGALEVLGGIAVLVVSPAIIVKIAEFVTAGELATDPNDVVATGIRDLARSFAVHPHYFLSSYLILHGLVKVLLVAGIFMKKKIAYPLFMAALIVFSSYEAYRGLTQSSLLLIALAAFDLILFVLTMYEYRRRYPRAA